MVIHSKKTEVADSSRASRLDLDRLADSIAKGETPFPETGDTDLRDAVRDRRRKVLIERVAQMIAEVLWNERATID